MKMAQDFGSYPNHIGQGKSSCSSAFRRLLTGGRRPSASPIDIMALCAKVGELTLENHSGDDALTKEGMLSAKNYD